MARARSDTVADDGDRLSDALWAQMEPLLPSRPSHPLGCHNPPKPARQVIDAIVCVLPWNWTQPRQIAA